MLTTCQTKHTNEAIVPLNAIMQIGKLRQEASPSKFTDYRAGKGQSQDSQPSGLAAGAMFCFFVFYFLLKMLSGMPEWLSH